MHPQRFRAATVRDALAAVKRVLGPEALVISTSLVPARGWSRFTGRRVVEITAALPAGLSESRPVAPTRPDAQGAESAAAAAALDNEIVARLVAAGVERALALEVAAAIPRRARRGLSGAALRDALAGRLDTIAAGSDDPEAVEVFVGPPGAGKTTTIAKIAARSRVGHGRSRGLIAADGYRVGAVEQLRLYADILAAPFAVARTARDLEAALASCRVPVLVGTAGRSPQDGRVRDLYDALAGRPGVRTHLVLAAGTSPRDAERVFDRYVAARPDRVVLTKTDETDSIAPLMRVLRQRRIPVSYLGTGQRVPEDLRPATAALLAATMLGDPSAAGEDHP
jgi:flagellar biosynthesis protein FlhF